MDNTTTVEPAPEPKKQGRPKGSKNKKAVAEAKAVEKVSAAAAEMAEIQRIGLQRQKEQRKLAPEAIVEAQMACPRKAIINRLRNENKIPDDMEPVFLLQENLRQRAYAGYVPMMDADRDGEYVIEPGGDVLALIPKKTYQARKQASVNRSASRVSEVDRTAEKLGIKNETTVEKVSSDAIDLKEQGNGRDTNPEESEAD